MQNNENEINNEEKPKKCSRCGETLPTSEFSKCKRMKDGLQGYCKTCMNEKSQERKINKPDEIKEYQVKYYENNKDKLIEQSIEWKRKNPEAGRIAGRKYAEKNGDKIKVYRLETRRSTIEYNKIWIKDKRENDINFYITEKLRHHLGRGLKNYFNKKEQKTVEYLGCTIEELLLYWESIYGIKLTLDMMGRGKGKWSIDHIKPIDSFDLSNEENIKICFHYTNLQPMLFEENCSKRNKY